MTIYLDALFFLNFFFDFLLLLTVSITLKRNVKLRKVFFGSLIGSISIFSLFLNFNNITLFLFKIILSLIMISITFGIKDKKYLINNMAYFYMTSVVLGGFLYFLNLSFRENVSGLMFVYDDVSINYLFLVIISPIILYIYYKQRREVSFYNKIVPVTFSFYNGKTLKINGFIDTGNKLIDPITKKKIVLINKKKLKGVVSIRSPMYVPYNTLNHHGLIKCIKLSSIEIFGIKKSDYLLGISEDDLLNDGVDCLLNFKCLEDFYVK